MTGLTKDTAEGVSESTVADVNPSKASRALGHISVAIMEPSTPLTNEGSGKKLRTVLSQGKNKLSTGEERLVSDSEMGSPRSKVSHHADAVSNDGSHGNEWARNGHKSVDTREITESIRGMMDTTIAGSSYNVRTLPNTKAEAVRWVGVSDWTYEKYYSVEGGRLSNHEWVVNRVDATSLSSLYNNTTTLTKMIKPYVVDMGYHKVDSSKKDFGMNDRARFTTFDQKYDGKLCLYEHTTRLVAHFSSRRYPYVLLYEMLSKGTDLAGHALDQWNSYVESASLSLIKDDVTNMILQSMALQSYQMREIAEMICDLIVFRVLIFGKVKSKVLVRDELQKKKLKTTLPGAHYDGILHLVQNAIHMSRLFLDEDTAVQDLVNTLVYNVHKTSPGHSMLAIDLNTNLSKEIRAYRQDNKDELSLMNKRDATLSIFGCIEKYCRSLQTTVHQTLSAYTEAETTSMAVPSVASPNSYSREQRRQQPTHYAASPSSTYPHTSFKKAQVHSAQVQAEIIGKENIDDDYLYERSGPDPIDEVVMAELESIHRDGKAGALRSFYWDADYSKLPAGTAVLPSREIEGAMTIHVNMIQAAGDGPGEVRMLDTKCSVEPRYSGMCAMCGKNGHDQAHCRIRGYNTGPNGEALVNLAAWSYFPDDKVEEEMRHAIERGFLKDTTEAEQQWVRQTVKRLQSERFLLYQGTQGRSTGYSSGRQQNSPYNRSNSPSPYSGNGRASSPYGNRFNGGRDTGIYGPGDKSSSL
jgi:hypothetical protein